MKLRADDKGLRDAFGLGLHGVREVDAPAPAVAQKLLDSAACPAAWR